jgi:hypothetical protein
VELETVRDAILRGGGDSFSGFEGSQTVPALLSGRETFEGG